MAKAERIQVKEKRPEKEDWRMPCMTEIRKNN